MKNKIVDIFRDPETRKILEGKARLVQKEFDLEPSCEYWTVKFVGDKYTVERSVNRLDIAAAQERAQ